MCTLLLAMYQSATYLTMYNTTSTDSDSPLQLFAPTTLVMHHGIETPFHIVLRSNYNENLIVSIDVHQDRSPHEVVPSRPISDVQLANHSTAAVMLTFTSHLDEFALTDHYLPFSVSTSIFLIAHSQDPVPQSENVVVSVTILVFRMSPVLLLSLGLGLAVLALIGIGRVVIFPRRSVSKE